MECLQKNKALDLKETCQKRGPNLTPEIAKNGLKKQFCDIKNLNKKDTTNNKNYEKCGGGLVPGAGPVWL